jgi:hypothetical protein
MAGRLEVKGAASPGGADHVWLLARSRCIGGSGRTGPQEILERSATAGVEPVRFTRERTYEAYSSRNTCSALGLRQRRAGPKQLRVRGRRRRRFPRRQSVGSPFRQSFRQSNHSAQPECSVHSWSVGNRRAGAGYQSFQSAGPEQSQQSPGPHRPPRQQSSGRPPRRDAQHHVKRTRPLRRTSPNCRRS